MCFATPHHKVDLAILIIKDKGRGESEGDISNREYLNIFINIIFISMLINLILI